MNIFKILILSILAFSSIRVLAQSKAESPYIIHERGSHMTQVSIIKDLRGKENTIQIAALNVSGGIGRVAGPDMPGADITEVLATKGSFNSIREVSKTGRGESVQLVNVVFPIRVRITISGENLEVEIREEGTWKISVGLRQ